MARELFNVEKGFGICEIDGGSAFEILQGVTAPGGDGAEQDAAPLSSLYSQNGTSNLYKKVANNGDMADWELLAGGQNQELEAGVSTTATVLDSLLIDECRSAIWLVTAFDEANPDSVSSQLVHATNNGTATLDATVIDDNLFSKNAEGSFNREIATVLTGAGAAQEMQLVVTSAEPGVTFTSTLVTKAASGY